VALLGERNRGGAEDAELRGGKIDSNRFSSPRCSASSAPPRFLWILLDARFASQRDFLNGL